MAKQSGSSFKPPKKRGRKRKPGRPVGWRKQVKPQSEVDDLESITAQTATNLKAFRFLFASHDEESEEEFLGYYPREIMDMNKTSRRKVKKITKEISSLETSLKEAQQHESIHSSSQLSLMVGGGKESNAGSDNQSVPFAPGLILAFPGFLDTDPLKETCRAKSVELFRQCEGFETFPRTNESRFHIPETVKKAICKKKKMRVPQLMNGTQDRPLVNSEYPHLQVASMRLEEFVQKQSIAGEITVTPILQSDVPMAVKGRHDSQILISCLPQT